ncbi:MAG: M48 family metallopeptidase [Actinomycetia bacterium]|nr:M48 family metallopeptidase [Actinomycetes bacterium]
MTPESHRAIAYTVRVSPKAKHVRITVTRDADVVVTVPRRFPRRSVPAVVEARRAWILRALERARARREAVRAEHGDVLPATVVLPATGETLAIEYRASAASGVTARQSGGVLALTGTVNDEAACAAALGRWLVRSARASLDATLTELAITHGFTVARLRVGLQRSRWGSCSAHGTVSLNAKLLFLPPELVRYVMLHELCHTRVMDHSARFWALVGQHDPGFELHRRALRDAERLVPPWAGERR